MCQYSYGNPEYYVCLEQIQKTIIPSKGDIVVSWNDGIIDLNIYFKDKNTTIIGVIIATLKNNTNIDNIQKEESSFYSNGYISNDGRSSFKPCIIKVGKSSKGFNNDNFTISTLSNNPYDRLPEIYLGEYYYISTFCELINNNYSIFCKFDSNYLEKFSGRYYNLGEEKKYISDVKLFFIKKNSAIYNANEYIDENEYIYGNENNTGFDPFEDERKKNNNDSSGGGLDKVAIISIIVICVLGFPCFLAWIYNLCYSSNTGSVSSSGNRNNNNNGNIIAVGVVISSTTVRVVS